MKKIIALIFVAASLLSLTTSCNKTGYGTYDFTIINNLNISDSDRAATVLGIIQSDSYFTTTKHSYQGTFDDAVKLAAADFDAHIQTLDVASIEAQLKINERVVISLWSVDPGQRWLSYVITSGGFLAEQQQN